MFDKIGCFTDIHFGARHNSKQHNEDCLSFVKWFVDESKKRNVDTCIFLGDWSHHRNTVNVLTMNYTMAALEILNNSFNNVYLIVGNHDMYFRESRGTHSLILGKEFKNITLVDSPIIQDNVAIIPWLVGDEWKDIVKIKTKYMFGHFEIPGFKMNAMVEMPDHGTLSKTHFKHQDYVFSGHFHMRQQSGNVHYIGNPFGHNYADAWDFNRGAMFLEWNGKPEYVNWEDGPKYITCYLSELIDKPEEFLTPNTYAKVTMDVDITYEEANFIRDTFIENYKIRELKLIYENKHEEIEFEGDLKFQTVDQLVIDGLNLVDSKTYDIKKLIEIYNGL